MTKGVDNTMERPSKKGRLNNDDIEKGPNRNSDERHDIAQCPSLQQASNDARDNIIEDELHAFITFHVRGTKYDVAQSTLMRFPDSLLTKLALQSSIVTAVVHPMSSNDDNNADEQTDHEIEQTFLPIQQTNEKMIDRDPNLFRYVLQYMRYNEVSLPKQVSKSAILKELDYFQLSNMRTNAVVKEHPTKGHVTNMFQFNMRHYILALANHCVLKMSNRAAWEDGNDVHHNATNITEVGHQRSPTEFRPLFCGLKNSDDAVSEGARLVIQCRDMYNLNSPVMLFNHYLKPFGVRLSRRAKSIQDDVARPFTFDIITCVTDHFDERLQKNTPENVERRADLTVDPSAVAYFNVGGLELIIQVSALKKYPDSMLFKLVSQDNMGLMTNSQRGEGAFPQRNSENDNDEGKRNISPHFHFIDRDGDSFQYVVEYMDKGKVVLPPHISRSMFMKDLDFYGIPAIARTGTNVNIQEICGFGNLRYKLEFNSKRDILELATNIIQRASNVSHATSDDNKFTLIYESITAQKFPGLARLFSNDSMQSNAIDYASHRELHYFLSTFSIQLCSHQVKKKTLGKKYTLKFQMG